MDARLHYKYKNTKKKKKKSQPVYNNNNTVTFSLRLTKKLSIPSARLSLPLHGAVSPHIGWPACVGVITWQNKLSIFQCHTHTCTLSHTNTHERVGVQYHLCWIHILDFSRLASVEIDPGLMSETLHHAVLGTEQKPIWFLMMDQLNPFYKVQVFY